ncbi:hypothetical protein ACRQ1B_12640 [Rhizobium panacihumi]|uniref:hypothetical protein n=1 Tax=Rhizobium panacihumi TaxID=2008450 RepID=UPI003D7A8B85
MRAPFTASTVALSVEQPVVASTIQQQSSSTLVCAFTALSTETSLVVQPVVAMMIQQQLSEGAATEATELVVHPVVATRIQQQSLEVIGFLLMSVIHLVNCPHRTLTRDQPAPSIAPLPNPLKTRDFGHPIKTKSNH